MGNFGGNTFWPWLGFEAQDDPLSLLSSDGFQPNDRGPMQFQSGTTSGSRREVVGLANWRPPGTPAVLQSQPRPWWLFGDETDPNMPWLHVRPPEPPGFRVAPDGTVASGPTGNATALGFDRQASNAGPVSPFVSGPFAQRPSPLADQPADAQAGWSLPQGQGERPDSPSGLPWLRADTTEEPPGFGVAPNDSIASSQTGNGATPRFDLQATNVGQTVPFVGAPFAQQTWPPTQASLGAQPWWSGQPGQGEEAESRSGLRWPWLRAEPTDEAAAFDVNRDGSGDRSNAEEFAPLSFAYQPFDQAPPATSVMEDTDSPQVGAAPTSLNPSQQLSGVESPTAASIALAAAPAVAGCQSVGALLSEAARAAAAEAAALAGRLAPAAARAASGPAAALSVLVTPTNSQGETIELGDGLRARTSTGQASVTIERRVDNGVLGIGARWEPLPVRAQLRVEEGGVARILIDHQQLQAAIGAEATTRALDAIASKMARPPNKGDGNSRSQADTAKQPESAPNPDSDHRPPSWLSIVASTAALAAKILEQVNGPRSEAEEEAQIAQGCRNVMRARGEQTPDKQYRGKDGYDTAIGVRMHPLLPDPTPGRDFYPEDPSHLRGYIGEAELANLVQAQGNHVVVHFGNAPGIQGPDVLSIGPDGRFMAWDSKARSAERSVGPSMAASGFLKLEELQAYVEREITSGRLPPELGYRALREFDDGNYNVCTVGTANAHNGYVETVRNRKSSGPRRP